ncbi:helix-turn-helix transcriptional regulator [Bordetella genomosp. 12]|uniref:DNA-binding protein n=1 Tax=Bordetella genomosp. 12 TaxID=463035 RepID=A0A261VKS8_9BORD|nr:PAS domain-containing protein [Bordetella genomosp. 12]OZI74341.1 DNA-binding protein [Bordetella genomosp. 12]
MPTSPRTAEQQALLDQLQHIACGLSQTFAPFCEVVVHDLREPEQSILAIHNNLSGRQVGDPTTALGLARIADAAFPQVVANYANQFADGRQAKSTSIGVKDSGGRYVAALCLNVDLTLFRSMQSMLGQFSATDDGAGALETLDPPGAQALRARIDQFAARLASTPRSLKPEERRQLLRELKDEGFLDVRRAVEIVAQHLGVSRATVYSDGK